MIRIMRILLFSLTGILVLTTCISAQEIVLQKKFFGGWEFSIDGENYRKVGSGASDLFTIMSDNPAAIAELDVYRSKKAAAMFTGIMGGILLGWPLGGYLATDEWKDGYNIMIGVGIPLAVVSGLLESSATGKLKNAVSIYNDSLAMDAGRFRFDIGFAEKPDITGIELRLSF